MKLSIINNLQDKHMDHDVLLLERPKKVNMLKLNQQPSQQQMK